MRRGTSSVCEELLLVSTCLTEPHSALVHSSPYYHLRDADRASPKCKSYRKIKTSLRCKLIVKKNHHLGNPWEKPMSSVCTQIGIFHTKVEFHSTEIQDQIFNHQYTLC